VTQTFISPFGGGWGEEKPEKLMFERFLKRIDSLISLFAKIVKKLKKTI